MANESKKYIKNLKKNFALFDDKFYYENLNDIKTFEWVDLDLLKPHLSYLPDYMVPYYYEISIYKKDFNFFIKIFENKKELFDSEILTFVEDIATTPNAELFLDFLLNQYDFQEQFLNKILSYTFDSANYFSNTLCLLQHDKVNVSYNNQEVFFKCRQYIGTFDFYESFFNNKNFNINISTDKLVENCVVVYKNDILIDYILNKYKEETLDLFIKYSILEEDSDLLDRLIEKFKIKKIKLIDVSITELIQRHEHTDFIEYLIAKKEYINFLTDHLYKNNDFTPYLVIKLLGINLSITEPDIYLSIFNNIKKFLITKKMKTF